MGAKKQKSKARLDKFYYLAKEQGYRSRAAFKLIQLNRKYDFLSRCRTMVDLCAAPGGWCQVAVKNMPVGSLIIAVDLVPIKPIRGVKTLIGDITTTQCRAAIRRETNNALVDVVVCDGAPNVGGAWTSEAYTQSALTLEALRLATDVLAPKGTFITKVFRSKDYSALIYAFKQLFTKVEATKPAASRNASAEIFVVCQGYKAPSKIDPRLLDPKHLFKEVEEPPKVAGPDALIRAKIKQKRNREGYEEGLSSGHKPLDGVAFILGDRPIEMLGNYTTITLDGSPIAFKGEVAEAEDEETHKTCINFINKHPSTTDEIKILCEDLQVLGRTEFKQILKWRMAVKKELEKTLGKTSTTAAAAAVGGHKKERKEKGKDGGDEDDEDGDKEEEDPEEKMLREMSEIKDRLEHRRKKEKKKRRELKLKAKVRSAQMSQAEGIGEDNGLESLFSLSTIKAKRKVDTITDDADLPSTDSDSNSDDDDDGGHNNKRGGGMAGDSSSSDIDSDEEKLRYEAMMDDYLEESYNTWKYRQVAKGQADGTAIAKLKRRRRRLGDQGDLTSDEDDDVVDLDVDNSDDDEEEDDDEMEEDDGGLVVSLSDKKVGVAASGKAAAAQWFDQDLFEDDDLESDEEEEEEEEEEDDRRGRGGVEGKNNRGKMMMMMMMEKKVVENGGGAHSDSEEEEEEERGGDDSDSEVSEGELYGGKKKNGGGGGGSGMNGRKLTGNGGNTLNGGGGKGGEGEGFEVVPLAPSDNDDSSDGDSDDSEDEFETLDDNAKAEVMALAKKMLHKKAKDSIIEAAYNRYAFHDEGLPKWFEEDEKKYMCPIPQISGSEYAEAKAALKAIDARPIKKVAEAKARKRNKLTMRLNTARQKAEAIANQDDVPMKSKMRDIEKLYAAAKSGGKNGKGKGKSSSSRSDQYKKKGPPLDARLKKDRRGMKAAEKRAKKSGGKRRR